MRLITTWLSSSTHLLRVLAFTLAIATCSVTTYSQSTPVARVFQEVLESTVTDWRPQAPSAQGVRFFRLSGHTQQLTGAATQAVRMDGFPLPGYGAVSLALTGFDVLSPGAVVISQSGLATKPIPREFRRFYRGTVASIPGSFVYLALMSGYASGYVEIYHNADRMTRYVIAPLKIVDGMPSTMVVYEENAALRNILPRATCAAETLEGYGRALRQFREKGETPKNSVTKVVEIATDCDTELFTDHGSNLSRASNYVMIVWGAVSALYQRDMNLVVRIPYLRLWTSTAAPYPYTGANSSTLLDQLQAHWNANMGGVQRALAYLMSGVNGIGGIAYLGVLCNGTFGYGVNGLNNNIAYPATTYVWDTDVSSHEVGHNLSSPHTHSCSWSPAIDSCWDNEDGTCFPSRVSRLGSVMSYCHLSAGGTALRFHPRVASEIRTYCDNNSSCVYPLNSSSANDLRVSIVETPALGGRITNGATFSPVVYFSNVGTNNQSNVSVSVTIRNSGGTQVYTANSTIGTLNAGESAQVTFSSTSIATNGVYSVTAQITLAADENQRNNTLVVPFEIGAADNNTLNLTAPNTQATLTAGNTTNITWTQTGIANLRIEFTPDDGVTWQVVSSSTGAGAGTFTWTIPPVPTTKGRIRISNRDNATRRDVSDSLFTIRLTNDIQALEFVSPENSSRNTFPFSPRASVRNNGADTLNNVTVRYRMIRRSNNDTVYNQTAQTGQILPNATHEVTFPEISGTSATGSYSVLLRTELANDRNLGNDTIGRAMELVTLAAPTLGNPANNTTNQVVTNLAFSWNSVANANRYQLQIATDTAFTSNFLNDSTLTGLSRTVSGLTGLTTYHWRVRANRTPNAGPAGPWSARRSFTTQLPAPVLISPANGAVAQSTSPVLVWSSASAATQYIVQVSTASNFATLVVNDSTVTDTSRALSGLLNNTTYWWRCFSRAGTTISAVSASRSFVTLLGTVSLTTPSSGLVNQLTNQTFAWNVVSGATTYRLQIASDSLFGTLVFQDSLINTASRVVSGLPFNATIFWRVRAQAGSNFGNFSGFRSMRTTLAAPALQSPANSSENNPLAGTVAWSAVSGATSYIVQLATSAAFSTLLVNDSNVTATSRAYSGLSHYTTYHWRVIPRGNDGLGTMSAVRTFRTILPSPLLSSPANNAVGLVVPVILVWDTVPSATRYTVELSTDSLFSSFLVRDTNVVAARDTISQLVGAQTVFWRVAAHNGAATSAFSLVRRFQTVVGSPSLLSPANSAENQSLAAQLRWGTVMNASGYIVQLASGPDFSALIVNDSNVVDTTRSASGLNHFTQYWWRVFARAGSETSASSEVRTFRTILASPSLTTPANAAVNLMFSPTLTWGAVATATRYRVQVASDQAFTQIVLSDTNVTGLSRVLTSLAGNTTYWWRARAENASSLSDWSAAFSFTTTLEAPLLVSPANLAENVLTTPTLTWSATPGATSYVVQVASDAAFTTLFFNDSTVASTSRALTGLANYRTYHWRVYGRNAGGIGLVSLTRSFRTLLASPSLVVPVNGVLNQPLSPELQWSLVDSAQRYHVQVALDSQFTSVTFEDSVVTGVSRLVGGLATNTRYFWRTRASNATSVSLYSAIRSFTTTLAAPNLSEPANGSENTSISPTLSWTAVPGASTYIVQVSPSPTFSTLIFVDSLVAGISRLVPDLSNFRHYYWRVYGRNAGGVGLPSAVRQFRTILSTPVLTSPIQQAVNVSLIPTLQWAAVDSATSYRVDLASDSLFTGIVLTDTNVMAAQRSVSALTPNTRYFWRSRARNAFSTSMFSPTFSFTTTLAAPLLIAPANSAINQALTVLAEWQPVSGASGYVVQVATDSLFASPIVNDSNVSVTSRTMSGLSHYRVYWFRVFARNSGGIGLASSSRSFQTILASPTLLVPIANAVNVSIQPELSWTSVDSASRYRVDVANDSLFASIVFSDSLVTGTSVNVSTLNPNATYFWRALSSRPPAQSAYSSTRRFTTLLGSPELLTPANAAEAVGTSPTLTWSAPSGATSYVVQVSRDPAFSTLVIDDSTVAGTSKVITGLAHYRTYHWRVFARNTGGVGLASATRNFRTVLASPVLSAPIHKATGVVSPVTLSWSSVDSAQSYRLELSTDSLFSSFVLIDSTLGQTSRVVAHLGGLTRYHWRVLAQRPGSTSLYSTTFEFVTSLPAPILVDPDNNAEGVLQTSLFAWSSVFGATAYVLQIASDSTFASLAYVDSNVAGSSQIVGNLLPFRRYSWRVFARIGTEISPSSAIRTFRTRLPVPVLSGPANAATNLAVNPTLSWLASDSARHYRLEVSRNAAFSSLVFTDTMVLGLNRQLSGLQHSTQYWWRLQSVNGAVQSQYSSERTFTTMVAPPILVGPSNNATRLPTTLTIRWNGVPSAISYVVQVSTDAAFSSLIVNDSARVDTTYQLNSLSHYRRYHWRVIARGPHGLGELSAIWSFQTILGTPIVVSPTLSSGAQGPSVAFTWRRLDSAQQYRLQYAADSTFFTVLRDTTFVNSDTVRTLSGVLAGPLLYWRVGGIADTFGVWSTRTAFLTSFDPPHMLAPANNSANQEVTLTARWAQLPGATGYVLQVSSDSLFTTLAFADSSVVDTQRLVGGLRYNTRYFIRVMGRNGATISQPSPRFAFSTRWAYPKKVSPNSHELILGSQRTIFQWRRPEVGATYRFEIATDSLFGAGSVVHRRDSLSDTTITVSGMPPGVPLYWRVSSPLAIADNPVTMDTHAERAFNTASRARLVVRHGSEVLSGAGVPIGPAVISLRTGPDFFTSTEYMRVPVTVDPSGTLEADFENLIRNQYWIVIQAGTHISVGAVQRYVLKPDSLTNVDLTTAVNTVQGFQSLVLQSGLWSLRGGDLNGNGDVEGTDFRLISSSFGVSSLVPQAEALTPANTLEDTWFAVRAPLQGYWDGVRHRRTAVIVELRDGEDLDASQPVAHASGEIDSAGWVDVGLRIQHGGRLWLIVRHLGHISTASASRVEITAGSRHTYDFSDSPQKAAGFQTTVLQDGLQVIRSGDCNGDGDVSGADYSVVSKNFGVTTVVP